MSLLNSFVNGMGSASIIGNGQHCDGGLKPKLLSGHVQPDDQHKQSSQTRPDRSDERHKASGCKSHDRAGRTTPTITSQRLHRLS